MTNKKTLAALGLGALLVIGAAAVFLISRPGRLRSGDSFPPVESAKVSESAQDEKSNMGPVGESANSPGQTPPSGVIVIDPQTRAQMVTCVHESKIFNGISDSDSFASLADFFEKAVKSPPSEKQLQRKNIHVRTPSGEVLRLHLSPREAADGDSPDRMGLKLFGTDAENLPVPKEMPRELANLTSDVALARFRSQGTVVMEESIETQNWSERGAPDSSVRVSVRDGQVNQIEMYFESGRALLCGAEANLTVSCRCL